MQTRVHSDAALCDPRPTDRHLVAEPSSLRVHRVPQAMHCYYASLDNWSSNRPTDGKQHSWGSGRSLCSFCLSAFEWMKRKRISPVLGTDKTQRSPWEGREMRSCIKQCLAFWLACLPFFVVLIELLRKACVSSAFSDFAWIKMKRPSNKSSPVISSMYTTRKKKEWSCGERCCSSKFLLLFFYCFM